MLSGVVPGVSMRTIKEVTRVISLGDASSHRERVVHYARRLEYKPNCSGWRGNIEGPALQRLEHRHRKDQVQVMPERFKRG